MSESGERVEVRPYEPPAIVYEAPLEVRAGTPLALPGSPADALDREGR